LKKAERACQKQVTDLQLAKERKIKETINLFVSIDKSKLKGRSATVEGEYYV
jgi:hypothetical protein